MSRAEAGREAEGPAAITGDDLLRTRRAAQKHWRLLPARPESANRTTIASHGFPQTASVPAGHSLSCSGLPL